MDRICFALASSSSAGHVPICARDRGKAPVIPACPGQASSPPFPLHCSFLGLYSTFSTILHFPWLALHPLHCSALSLACTAPFALQCTAAACCSARTHSFHFFLKTAWLVPTFCTAAFAAFAASYPPFALWQCIRDVCPTFVLLHHKLPSSTAIMAAMLCFEAQCKMGLPYLLTAQTPLNSIGIAKAVSAVLSSNSDDPPF